MVRRVDPASSPQALDRHLPRDAGNAAGLAPQAGCEQVRHEQQTQALHIWLFCVAETAVHGRGLGIDDLAREP